MSEIDASTDREIDPSAMWRIRALFVLFIAVAVSVVWVTNHFLTQRFTESTRSRAEVRLALYSGNLLSELRRNSVVPLLLARDPTLIGALNSGDFSQSTQRLISYREEIGAASLSPRTATSWAASRGKPLNFWKLCGQTRRFSTPIVWNRGA